MARYDESYDGPYSRRGEWRGDFAPRGREFTPFPEMAPPRYSGGQYDPDFHAGAANYDRDLGRGNRVGGYDRDLDRGTGGGYDRGFAGPRRTMGYGGDYGQRAFGGQQQRFTAGPPRGWNAGPYATPPRRPDDLVGGRGGPRGEYGGAYEAYSPPRGGWGGQQQAYGRASQGRGYDAGYAREPFIPEKAYRRHPEYRQQPQPREWEAHQHAYGLDLSDDQIRASVHRRMSADAWLDPAGITVQVEDGVVTLTGEVDDYLKARYAWDDAWEADGVRGVVNNLTIRAGQAQPTHGDILPQSAGGSTTPDDLAG